MYSTVYNFGLSKIFFFKKKKKVHDVTFGPLAVKKQNDMHFAKEYGFGCASASVWLDEYCYPPAQKTFTTALKGIIHRFFLY